MKRFKIWGAACVFAALAGGARADILIGQTLGITGPVAGTVKELMAGARLYIDSVNAKGGIKGEKLELLTLDDGFDVKRAVENARILIEEKNAVALFMNRGTPHTEAMLPLIEKADIPLIAPSTGASFLHAPLKRQVFNVRSSYPQEAEKAIEHLVTITITRIAIVHVDDAFGRDGLSGARVGFAKANLQPVAVISADRDKPDYASIVPALVQSNAQAVLWIGTATAVSDGVRALRKAGSRAQVLTLSNNASNGFIQSLGGASQGVVVSQVFPSERAVSVSMVREAQEMAKGTDIILSPAVLEGFAAAKVLVEGLRRASPKPTRAKLIAALESMSKFDLGGLEVGYSPTDHTGMEFVELSIIGSDGKFRR